MDAVEGDELLGHVIGHGDHADPLRPPSLFRWVNSAAQRHQLSERLAIADDLHVQLHVPMHLPAEPGLEGEGGEILDVAWF